ncbi:hypothetical protein Micbo1qcDRAFT_156113 [Microdochium bolleyi]|uniref:Uncharacterized protein n=1 Tax=Microdochium bolleyi TaxID=196109 RepID=A0A136JJF6_9PEZI|nr:hypothetical protein Micbo1qcDRAFT_156113 [Microdochium bolleyi]
MNRASPVGSVRLSLEASLGNLSWISCVEFRILHRSTASGRTLLRSHTWNDRCWKIVLQGQYLTGSISRNTTKTNRKQTVSWTASKNISLRGATRGAAWLISCPKMSCPERISSHQRSTT